MEYCFIANIQYVLGDVKEYTHPTSAKIQMFMNRARRIHRIYLSGLKDFRKKKNESLTTNKMATLLTPANLPAQTVRIFAY